MRNPEMKEKMQSHMQVMMDKNPEMMQKMQSKVLDNMMMSENGRKMMGEIHNNEMVKMEMKEKMMNENPEMMKKMKAKMKNEG